MMPLFDVRCDNCQHVWEESKLYSAPASECPVCGSHFSTTLMPRIKHFKAKDPYDLLHGHIPATKQVKSFANDRRKGGKDTT